MLRIQDEIILFTGKRSVGGPVLIIGIPTQSAVEIYDANDPGEGPPESLVIGKFVVRPPGGNTLTYYEVSPMKE